MDTSRMLFNLLVLGYQIASCDCLMGNTATNRLESLIKLIIGVGKCN